MPPLRGSAAAGGHVARSYSPVSKTDALPLRRFTLKLAFPRHDVDNRGVVPFARRVSGVPTSNEHVGNVLDYTRAFCHAQVHRGTRSVRIADDVGYRSDLRSVAPGPNREAQGAAASLRQAGRR